MRPVICLLGNTLCMPGEPGLRKWGVFGRTVSYLPGMGPVRETRRKPCALMQTSLMCMQQANGAALFAHRSRDITIREQIHEYLGSVAAQ